ncbi:leucine-rich repeat-containing protein 40 [Nilaparvata lugens]|uniref:leucine-rich repeat-containing protein 40 n=1 Tax=Nilaparvata lugens TaxID=108931 RepID=UPI00193D7A41|nr:leucine-rich repeat-containing protein 40 [Nilaparvata lugens]
MKQGGKETVISVLKKNKNERQNSEKNDPDGVKIIRKCTTLGMDGVQQKHHLRNQISSDFDSENLRFSFCNVKMNFHGIFDKMRYQKLESRNIETDKIFVDNNVTITDEDYKHGKIVLDERKCHGDTQIDISNVKEEDENVCLSLPQYSYDLENADDVIGINREYHFLDQIQASKQKLTSLPKDISKVIDCPNHKHNKLMGINIEDEASEPGSSIIRLLDLSCNYLRQVSSEIAELSDWVQVFNLSNNQLASLPKEMGQLNQLEEIDVSYNLLKQLPRAIYKLRGLKYLFAKCNNISTVDKELRTLKKLMLLDLSHNNIRGWPYPVINFSSLVELNLSNNKLLVIPSGVHYMTGLKVLRLRGNSISRFTKKTRPPNLEILDLGENKIQTHPDFYGCTTLKQVWIDHNFIQQVEVNSFLSTSIRYLSLSHNKITTINGYFSSLENLNVLDLSGNLLKSLPFDLGCSERLTTLKIENNGFDDLNILEYSRIGTKQLARYLLKQFWDTSEEQNSKSNLSRYTAVYRFDPTDKFTYANDCQCIRMTVNESGNIPNWMFKKAEMEEVMRIDLSRNQLDQIPPNLWRTSPYLEELFLDENKFTVIPSFIGNFWKLSVLILKRNKLKALPARLSQCEHLHLLDISYNRFCELPSVIDELRSLRILYANNNRIAEISNCYEKLGNLDVIDLSNNEVEILS